MSEENTTLASQLETHIVECSAASKVMNEKVTTIGRQAHKLEVMLWSLIGGLGVFAGSFILLLLAILYPH